MVMRGYKGNILTVQCGMLWLAFKKDKTIFFAYESFFTPNCDEIVT